MFTYILGALASAAVFFVAIYLYVQDRKYLKSKTSEVMSERVKQELQQEREKILQQKAAFQKILEDAKRKAK